MDFELKNTFQLLDMSALPQVPFMHAVYYYPNFKSAYNSHGILHSVSDVYWHEHRRACGYFPHSSAYKGSDHLGQHPQALYVFSSARLQASFSRGSRELCHFCLALGCLMCFQTVYPLLLGSSGFLLPAFQCVFPRAFLCLYYWRKRLWERKPIHMNRLSPISSSRNIPYYYFSFNTSAFLCS